MKFYSLLNFSLIAICITYSQGAPLEPRVNTPIFVLNDNPKNTFSCNADQIAYIKAAVTKAAEITSSAANVYSAARMSQNPIVQSFLGDISEAAFQAEVTKRFKNVATKLEQALSVVSEDDIDKIQEDDALSFFCQNSKTLLAATSNKQDVPPSSENRIVLGKKFFQTESAEALFNKDKGIFETQTEGGDLTKWATALDNPGHTLVHEAQHSLILLGSTSANDNLKDLTNSAGRNNRPNACIALKTAAEKQSNAENWALLAFVAAVDPAGVSGCTPGTPPAKRALTKAKGTTATKAGTKAPLSCPFVPKAKTAATTGKTATPATSKTTKKTTAGTTTKAKTTTAKKGTVAKSKTTVPKKTTTAKKVTPAKTATKKTTAAKKVTPVKKTAPVKKVAAPKKATPVKKTAPVKKVAAPKKVAPKKVAPKKVAPKKVAVKKTAKRV